MEAFTNLINVQSMMFLLMLLGFILRRINLVTIEGKKLLTDLILDVLLPANIISSFYIEMNPDIVKAGIEVLMMSIGIQAVCVAISAFCYRRIPAAKRRIFQYGTVCSNSGILGNPLAEGIYGATGLLYASLFTVPQRIVMWSVGVSYFTESPDLKTMIKKVMTHPCIVACIIGMALMVSQVKIPVFLELAINKTGGCTTAISMIFIGTVLADGGVKGLLSKYSIAYSVIRLFVLPTMVLIACMVMHIDKLAGSVSVILAAMPAGSTTAILAAKYDGDEVFATQVVFLTTVLSLVLLPVWSLVLEVLL